MMEPLWVGLTLLLLAFLSGWWLTEQALKRRTETTEEDKVIQSMREWLGTDEVFVNPEMEVKDKTLLSVEAEDPPVEFEWQPGPSLMRELPHIHVNGRCVKRRYGVAPCNRGWK